MSAVLYYDAIYARPSKDWRPIVFWLSNFVMLALTSSNTLLYKLFFVYLHYILLIYYWDDDYYTEYKVWKFNRHRLIFLLNIYLEVTFVKALHENVFGMYGIFRSHVLGWWLWITSFVVTRPPYPAIHIHNSYVQCPAKSILDMNDYIYAYFYYDSVRIFEAS